MFVVYLFIYLFIYLFFFYYFFLCSFCGLEVINHLNILFGIFFFLVRWTLRVVSKLLIGPQGEEKKKKKNFFCTYMAPT